jgi:hypothetical protein
MITMMPVQAPVPPPPRPPQQRRAGQAGDLLPLGDWIRHYSLRSWPVALFLLLICVPTIALVILGPSPSASTFDHVAWIFAAYFAVAWLLLLGVIIRPEHVTRPMLVLVTVIALATQVPLAVTLEVDLHAETAGLGPSIWSVGLPEELAKAIPVLAVAVIYRLGGRHELTPKDYLFLGAVSGLVFGASEVVHYFTVNGLAEFYLTVQSALPSPPKSAWAADHPGDVAGGGRGEYPRERVPAAEPTGRRNNLRQRSVACGTARLARAVSRRGGPDGLISRGR